MVCGKTVFHKTHTPGQKGWDHWSVGKHPWQACRRSSRSLGLPASDLCPWAPLSPSWPLCLVSEHWPSPLICSQLRGLQWPSLPVHMHAPCPLLAIRHTNHCLQYLASWSFLSVAQPALSELLANPSLPVLTLPRPSACFKALTQPTRPTLWTPNCFTWHLSPVIRFLAISSLLATTPFHPHTLQPSNPTYSTRTLTLSHHSSTLYTLLCL